MGEVEMLPWAVTMIEMMMWLPVMLLLVFEQAGPHLPREEEARRKLSHCSVYRFSKSLPTQEDALLLAGPMLHDPLRSLWATE